MEDYIPFGDQWKSEMMKFPKTKIIEILRDKCLELNAVKLMHYPTE